MILGALVESPMANRPKHRSDTERFIIQDLHLSVSRTRWTDVPDICLTLLFQIGPPKFSLISPDFINSLCSFSRL